MDFTTPLTTKGLNLIDNADNHEERKICEGARLNLYKYAIH